MSKESILLQSGEEIKSIIGYEGIYSITSFGRVWSHERLVKNGKDSYRVVKVKFLKPGLDKEGYRYVILEREKKIYKIHRLVATHYILNPDYLLQVNHKDGIKINNRKDNLEWCTDRKNKNHAMENKLYIFKRTSKYYGVYFNKSLGHKNKPWISRITVNKKVTHIGSYKTEIEAAKAYNAYVIKHNLDRPLNKF